MILGRGEEAGEGREEENNLPLIVLSFHCD